MYFHLGLLLIKNVKKKKFVHYYICMDSLAIFDAPQFKKAHLNIVISYQSFEK